MPKEKGERRPSLRPSPGYATRRDV
jgi:hypothetical protein